MSVNVSDTKSQDVSFDDQIFNTFNQSVKYCGKLTYTLSPMYSFISISGSTITLTTLNVYDVGTYQIILTVSLTDYPGVTSKIKNFTVQVYC